LPNEGGFTLLELLVAVTVATILLTIGIPSFMNMVAENQRITYTAELFSNLNFARGEAITRNTQVVICKSAEDDVDGDGDRVCNDSRNWSDGWIVYANVDGMTTGNEPDANETVLRAHDGLSPRFTLSSDDFPNRIVYLPSGRATANGDLALCTTDPDVEERRLQITATGRPRSTKHTCSGG